MKRKVVSSAGEYFYNNNQTLIGQEKTSLYIFQFVFYSSLSFHPDLGLTGSKKFVLTWLQPF